MPANPLRRLAPFLIIGGVGLILVIYVGWMRLTHEQGTVGQCQVELTRPSRIGIRYEVEVCDVTWESGGTTHRSKVRMDGTGHAPGETVDLLVSGEHARRLSISKMVIALVAGQGALLLLAAAFVAYRRMSK